jgi:hypothetical protein
MTYHEKRAVLERAMDRLAERKNLNWRQRSPLLEGGIVAFKIEDWKAKRRDWSSQEAAR